MHNYVYVPEVETKPVRVELEKLIKEVQAVLRPWFTFRWDIVGSAKRNMITCDEDSNIGFDFDYNIEVNYDDRKYSAEQIKQYLMAAFRSVMGKYYYSKCENSTRVITIKKIDYNHKRIEHSCDFAIVHNYVDEDNNDRQEYIHYDKKSNSYEWHDQPEGYDLEDKIGEIKRHKLWDDVRNMYIELKRNDTVGKKSRSLFAEAVNNIYNEYINE